MTNHKQSELLENIDTLKEVTHEFDHNTGRLLINLETLHNINTELGIISEDVRNTNTASLTDMGMRFRDINHKINLLADLLQYTMKDIDETYDQTRLIQESYFDLIIRAGEEGESNE